MSCQSETAIDDYLVFSITTHDPTTGVLTDADSVPAYRIYEDEAATPILTGTMAKLDDSNTTGFYAERIACTAANGFEDGKSYTVYIEATVSTYEGGISYGFRVKTDVDTSVWSYASRTLTQSAATVVSAVSGSDLNIMRGDTFTASITGLGDISNRSKLWFTVKLRTDDLDAESIVQIEESAGLIYINGADASARSSNGSITVDDASLGNITIELDEVETAVLLVRSGLWYDIQVLTTSDDVNTLTIGDCNVSPDITRVTS